MTCCRNRRARRVVGGAILGWAALAGVAAAEPPPQPAPPAPTIAEPRDIPFPGVIGLTVDVTDLAHAIFRAHETIPVAAPGPLTLLYPEWLPGNHSPTGPIDKLAGLTIRGGGKPLEWRRDPVDVYAFHIDVPAGVSQVDVDLQFLSPVSTREGRVMMTPEMLRLQWNTVALYPAGYFSRDIPIQATIKLPPGFTLATALDTASVAGSVTTFKTTSFNTFIDSPLMAGLYFKRFDLDPGGPARVTLDVMADQPEDLETTADEITAHRNLVSQAYKLYASHHYDHYDFLFWLSDKIGGQGLEHHQSSEDGTAPKYFTDWAKGAPERDLLAHEYTHSWNGKFRRPADLLTPNTNTPMQDSLLWMYEGQTQFWGYVLAARAGLVPLAEMRDTLADSAAWLQAQQGRAWRNLQDTTNQPVMEWRTESGDWRDWQRGSDYYDEMALVWLEADMLIRDASGGARSLDDFARAFFGAAPDRAGADLTPLTYRFDDVVAALNRIEPHDWAHFLRTRLDTHRGTALLQGLERSGWRLGWSDEPNSFTKGSAAQRQIDDFSYSLGFDVGKENALASVRWGSPAFAAGLSSSVRLIAVNGLAYKADRLKAAITEAKTGGATIQLLVKDGDHYRTVPITYTGGLRYPKLERIEGTEDRLTQVLTARP